MTETEDPGHDEVAQRIADVVRWAASQPLVLTPEQVRAQPLSTTSRRRWRPPRLRTGMIGLAAAVLVVVTVSVILVTGNSPPSAAQVRQKIAAAEALSARAGTIRIDWTLRQTGEPVVHYHYVILPASGVTRLFYLKPNSSFYVTEVDDTSTGYVRMTWSRTVSIATPGWVSFPLGTVTNPAPIRPGSPGGLGGDVGPITHLGTKTIDGVRATGYGVTVSVRALIAQAKTERDRNVYRTEFLERGITRFPSQIWLDSSGHVRELHWTVHPRYNGTSTSTELSSYSRAVATINFPPPDDVTAAANQGAAYAQALRNALAGESG